VAERANLTLRARLERLRASALILAQVSVAAGLAWLVATKALGHDKPFFAPVSAIICVGLSYGQRGRRVVELVFGVALGILVGDAIVLVIGTGAWQLTVVVLLAMSVAVLLGTGPLGVTQAAVSAALVVTLQPPGSGYSGARFLDSLTGGIIALVISTLVLPHDPLADVRRAVRPVLADLASVLHDVAEGLRHRDREALGAALLRARAIDETGFREALDAGRETARTAPPRRGSRGHLELYAAAAAQIDLVVRGARILARGAIRAIDLGDHVPAAVPGAIDCLAEAVRRLELELEHPERDEAAREAALSAAAMATSTLEETANLSSSFLVAQVRSTAVDLLRGMGDDGATARSAVRSAASSEMTTQDPQG
jgi:uncharacterized membrane protein YccC